MFVSHIWIVEYVCFSYLDPNECNLISNEIYIMFGLPFLGEMRFDNYISSQMKLNILIKYKANHISSQMRSKHKANHI